MRSFISKAVITTMIAGAALAVSACTKTETTTNITELNVSEESVNDTMTPIDAGNGSGMMSNDTMAPANAM